MEQEFERHPELAKEIESMASSGNLGSPEQWSNFLRILNTALAHPSRQREVELPSDEDIAEEAASFTLTDAVVFASGVKWLRDKIKSQLSSHPSPERREVDSDFKKWLNERGWKKTTRYFKHCGDNEFIYEDLHNLESEFRFEKKRKAK